MHLPRLRRFACALFRPCEQDAHRLVHCPDIRVHRLRVRHADADGKARIRKHREIVDAVAHRRHLLRRDAQLPVHAGTMSKESACRYTSMPGNAPRARAAAITSATRANSASLRGKGVSPTWFGWYHMPGTAASNSRFRRTNASPASGG